MIPRRAFHVLFVFLMTLFPIWIQSQDKVDPELLAGMKARSIGPAGMSGRIAAVDAVRSNPDIVYVGAATGGVWKSVNGGVTWSPVFDKQSVAAIGAIAIFQPNPDIVWAGTGEGNVRNSASVGDGIYKSLDGGRTWKNVGLAKSERISRIVAHPTNPDIVYVAALGQAWGENQERGVFKTEDGGKTWQKILYVDEKTGAADVIIDPSNPNKLFAAMWQYRRWPWVFKSGGPGSGLYVTMDSGSSWKKLTEEDGIPKGQLGRIGLSISRSFPNIVYALVEAEKSALIRSEDGGISWSTMNTEANVASRPFYFADIHVDPELPNRIYRLETTVQVSNDSGRTFATLVTFAMIHPDHHALWINPIKPAHLILGNDGGVAFSQDRGKTWRFVGNIPVAQYYHVRVDMDRPYHVYGGMQDNGSWRGPSSVWESDGIRNHYWDEVGFGDGFDTIPDPSDSMKGYAMAQEGYLIRWDLRTGERKDIRPPPPNGIKLRFNWNAALAIDPFDGNTIYYGSQFLHKSTDRGESWKMISPDLTSNNPDWQKASESGGITPDVTGAENFTTIIAIAPSPVQKDMLWVGTDDGRIQLTRDAGKTWTSLEKNVQGVPANAWIPHITGSKYDAATAYVVVDDHRRSNWTTYVYKTTNYGSSWTSLATNEISGYALAIAEDTIKSDLLFLGTEFGLYVTLNGGKNWMKWTHNFPTVSAMDLLVHPREQDLVVATHGRAAYILDDIRPLRTVSAATLKKPIHLFEIPDAQQYWVKQVGGSRFPGQSEFEGQNRPYGAMITFSLNEKGLPYPDPDKEKELKEKQRQTAPTPTTPKTDDKKEDDEKSPKAEIQITDSQGKVIRTFKTSVTLGVNRATWDLSRDAFKTAPRDEKEDEDSDPSGPEMLPGTYGVSIKYKDQAAKGNVKILPDPRFNISDSDRTAKWNAILQAGQLQETLTKAILQLQNARSDITTVVGKIKQARKQRGDEDKEDKEDKKDKDSPEQKVLDSADALQKELNEMEKKLWTPPDTKGYVAEKDVLSQINYASYFLTSSWDKPTEAQLIQLKFAEELLKNTLVEYNQLFADKVAAFRKQVQDLKIDLLPDIQPIPMNSMTQSQSSM